MKYILLLVFLNQQQTPLLKFGFVDQQACEYTGLVLLQKQRELQQYYCLQDWRTLKTTLDETEY